MRFARCGTPRNRDRRRPRRHRLLSRPAWCKPPRRASSWYPPPSRLPPPSSRTSSLPGRIPMSAQCPPRRAPRPARERGQAMLLTVLLLGVGVSAVVYNFVTPAKQSIERDKITDAALAQAKDALIGFAAGRDLVAGANRPGDLPCPDLDDDGDADAVPGCDTAARALGRLPWKTLGLPDLRDGYGQRLRYAVSSSFKNNTLDPPCANPGDAGCLNSDARGKITVRSSDGTIIHDGSPIQSTPSGAIAVIFAPGAVLRSRALPARRIEAVRGEVALRRESVTAPH